LRRVVTIKPVPADGAIDALFPAGMPGRIGDDETLVIDCEPVDRSGSAAGVT